MRPERYKWKCDIYIPDVDSRDNQPYSDHAKVKVDTEKHIGFKDIRKQVELPTKE